MFGGGEKRREMRRGEGGGGSNGEAICMRNVMRFGSRGRNDEPTEEEEEDSKTLTLRRSALPSLPEGRSD